MKKNSFIVFLISCMILMAMSSMFVFANDDYEIIQTGEEINAWSLSQAISINGDPVMFNSIMKVVKSESGENVIYLPIRLAISDYSEEDSDKNGLDFTTSVNTFSFDRGQVYLATSFPTDKTDVNGTVFHNLGVIIDWGSDAPVVRNSKHGVFSTYIGIRPIDGGEPIPVAQGTVELKHELIIENVKTGGGGRLFLSLEDWNDIVSYLANDGYSTETKTIDKNKKIK